MSVNPLGLCEFTATTQGLEGSFGAFAQNDRPLLNHNMLV
jgi:hypothetical protein